MKLLFNLGAGIYPYVVGGMEIFNYYFIKNLKKRFNILYTSTKPLNIEGLKWFKTYNIKPTKIFTPLQLLIKLLFNPSIKKVVISYSAAHWLVWYLYTMIRTILGREYFVIIHYGDAAPKGSYNTYKRFFGNAKKVVAVSHDIKKNFDSKYNIDCEVLYPLVPFEHCATGKTALRAKYNIPESAYLITMVGSVKRMKNPDTLLKALSKFTKEDIEKYNIHLAYAGTGNMLEQLKREAEQLRLGSRVHFLGFVPKEQVNEVFKMSDAYTIASDFEGTSVSLLEAMYNKLPILASDAPGINDMVNSNCAFMFKTKDAEELKKQILAILFAPELAGTVAQIAHNEYKKKYNYENILERYINIFQE